MKQPGITAYKAFLQIARSVSILRGPGGGVFIKISSKSTLWLFLIERSNSYQTLFIKLKNIALSLKYCWSKVSAVV